MPQKPKPRVTAGVTFPKAKGLNLQSFNGNGKRLKTTYKQTSGMDTPRIPLSCIYTPYFDLIVHLALKISSKKIRVVCEFYNLVLFPARE